MPHRFEWETTEELNKGIADRLRLIRKRKKYSQERLSELSGVSLGSVKRFERTGNISLASLTRIAKALDVEDELRKLFNDVPYMNIQEVLNERR